MRRIAVIVLCATSAAVALAGGDDFHFAIVGDRTGGHVAGVYGEIVDEVNRLAPMFVVSVGDQIEGYSEDPSVLNAEWDEYWGIASRLEAPFYPCAGNHDIYNDVMLGVWRERTEREPCYTFDYEGVHFVVLDTGRWETSADWLEQSGYAEWLKRDLAKHRKARLTVVVYHKPYWFDTLAEGKEDPMHDIFVEYGVDAVFNGHYHVYGAAEYDGISYVVVGSSGAGLEGEGDYPGAFFQYVWGTVRGDKLSWAVLARGSARPADVVLAADHKAIEKISFEYVQVPTFRLEPGDEPAETTCAVYVENPGDAELATTITWEAGANWEITPAAKDVAVPAGDAAEVEFAARQTGELYPLPVMRLAYPYREGKTFTYETPMPAARTQPVRRFAAAPAIDGELGDACWADAATADYFCSPAGGPAEVEPTTFYFGYDDDNLYLGARCRQEDITTLVASASERDAFVHTEDCVGYFLLPRGGEDVFYQIYANALGTVYDVKYSFAPPAKLDSEGPAAWNGEYELATSRGEDYWALEAAIPFATLGVDGALAGDSWRVNFRRKEQAKGSSADWQYPIGFDPRRFGYMVFE